MLKIALAGVGGISGAHIPAWEAMKDAELVALCDIRPEQMEKYPDKRHYTDFDEMLGSEEIDILDICLPTYLHADYAVRAMENGDIVALGGLLNASHKSLKELYEVTGIELDALAEAAQAYPGCVGSRMTGAGFGGCTISLVKREAVEDFKKVVGEKYYEKIGYRATFYSAEIADGITVTQL